MVVRYALLIIIINGKSPPYLNSTGGLRGSSYSRFYESPYRSLLKILICRQQGSIWRFIKTTVTRATAVLEAAGQEPVPPSVTLSS